MKTQHRREDKKRQLIVLGVLLIMGIASAIKAEPKYIPVVSGLFTTGQWYFDGDKSSLGGNLNLTFVPAVRFSNTFSLIPSVDTYYRGTRSAQELAGGNTLFQDTWESGINVKAVHGLGRKWKLREKIGYRAKLLRETTDEDFGDGLYDYQVPSIGAEIEHLFTKKFNVALGYDYSFLVFPNYVSLESGQSTDTAREFAGEDVLDSEVHLASMRTGFPFFWRIEPEVQVYYSPRLYTDQTVVVQSGLLTQEKRKDFFTGFTVALDRMFSVTRKANLLTSGVFGYTALQSNQNHYDAQLTEFVPDYYDYDEQRYGLQFSLALGTNQLGPQLFDLGGSFVRRDYRQRTTQDATGSFLNDKLYTKEYTLNMGYSYPLAKNFRLRTTATFGQAKSNNKYEELYRYNFNNANYQFGFTYDY